MESLPSAMPELTAGLAAADRTTAPRLALEPDDAPGATAAEPFATVLAMLTAAPDGGDALPSGGNELPAESVDPAAAGVALPLPIVAVPTAPPAPVSSVPRASESATRTSSMVAPIAAPPAHTLDTAAQQPITDVQAQAQAQTQIHVDVPGADVAEQPDAPASDASRASTEDLGQAAAAVRDGARENGSRGPQPFAAWLQQRAADAGAQHDSLAPAIRTLQSAAAGGRELGVRETEAMTADRLDGSSRAAPDTALQWSTQPQVTPSRTNDAAIHFAGAAELGPAPQQQQSPSSAALPAPAVQPAQASASAPNGQAEPTAAAQSGSVDMAAPRWNEALAGRVQWMVDHELGEARIKLNPPELGALDVKIAVHDDKTFVQLSASSAAARDELAHSLPRLRELLSMGGLTLGGATVSGGGSDGGHSSATADGAVARAFEPAEAPGPAASAPRPRAGAARIDLYA